MSDLNNPGVLRNSKMNVRLIFQTALAYYQTGNLQQAEHLFREIIKAAPKNFEAHYYLANILQDTGRDEEAVQSYQRAMEINPDFPGTYYNMGSILKEKGMTMKL